MSFRVRSLLWVILWLLFSQPHKELVYMEGNTCCLFEAAFLSQPLNFRGTLRGQLGPRIWALLLIFVLNLLSCVYTFITVSGVELNYLGIKWFFCCLFLHCRLSQLFVFWHNGIYKPLRQLSVEQRYNKRTQLKQWYIKWYKKWS